MEKTKVPDEAGEPTDSTAKSSHKLENTCYGAHSETEGSYEDLHSSRRISLSDLPEEILEHILAFLSPYQDMESARLVSKLWFRVIQSVIKHQKRRFYHGLSTCEIQWTKVSREKHYKIHGKPKPSTITDRFSHSAAYYDGSMYVFGGCTSSNTTFNDLWRFDLTSRQWVRPVAMGKYPSPKACATMVVYNGHLVLFGGWSHPIPYPLHQSAHYFSELHVYSPVNNRWSHIMSLGQEPEALGGHSASVVGDLMVVFGGSPRPGSGTNNLWVFNFVKASWKLQPVFKDMKPEPRYGQYQTTLDNEHILIMGGCVGQNRVYNDMWLLKLDPTGPWQWTKLTIVHPELSALQTWCHATCRVKDMIVVIGKSPKDRQARNVKSRRSYPQQSQQKLASGSDLPPKSPTNQPEVQGLQQQQHRHHFEAQRPRQLPISVESTSSATCSHCSMEEYPAQADGKSDGVQQVRNNLLALQQKLHRECVNLPDPDNHHHNPHRLNQVEPEGHFLRLNNRWGDGRMAEAAVAPAAPPPASPPQAAQQIPQHQLPAEAVPGPAQPHPQPHNLPAWSPTRAGNGKPSIRPNATCNRQKQLEALQRQEELLRTKLRALAATKKSSLSDEQPGALDLPEEEVPEVITTKNKMDIHVVDISQILSKGVAEWQPISELQASGAPTETICCSLIEGRGELILFGGVIREVKSPAVTNTAINKLYLLHDKSPMII